MSSDTILKIQIMLFSPNHTGILNLTVKKVMKKESFLHLSYIKSNRYNDEDANKITCVCSFASVVSNPVQHYGQPTRLLSPWGSPGKNTGVGCHGLLITI